MTLTVVWLDDHTDSIEPSRSPSPAFGGFAPPLLYGLTIDTALRETLESLPYRHDQYRPQAPFRIFPHIPA